MLGDTCVPAMALPPGDRTDPHDSMSFAVGEPSSDFVEAVAKLLQKRKVRVARHLHVCVEADQMHLMARCAMDWDESYAADGMSQASVVQLVEQVRVRLLHWLL